MTARIVATAFGGPEVLAVEDVTVPAPGPGEVTIAVRAAAVNPFDHKRYSGAFGTDPAILTAGVGLELSGVVTATGQDAAGPAGPVAVGDEVIAFPAPGAYAELVTVPAATVVPKPAELSFDEAAGVLSVGATAVHLLDATKVTAGDTVLVNGAAGSVGQAVVQLAVAAGATVIGTAAERNHDLLRSLGAIPVGYGPGLIERVRESAPQGVDVALDLVGTDEAVDTSLELVADRDRIASIVAFGRGDTGIRLLGGGPGADPGTEIRANAWRTLLPAAADGALRVRVVRTYPLRDAAAANAFVKDGHAAGKVILKP